MIKSTGKKENYGSPAKATFEWQIKEKSVELKRTVYGINTVKSKI